MTLSHLSKKQAKAVIVGFQGESNLIERLSEMGLILGCEVSFICRAPFAGPLVIRFGSTVIALRPEEAACAQISLL